MKGVLRIGGKRVATIKLRLVVKSIPKDASITVTDTQLQPGRSVSGWMPHVTELPWSAGVSE